MHMFNMRMHANRVTAVLLLLVASAAVVGVETAAEEDIGASQLLVRNEALARLEIFWKGVADGGVLHPMAEIRNGSEGAFNTFTGHTFVLVGREDLDVDVAGIAGELDDEIGTGAGAGVGVEYTHEGQDAVLTVKRSAKRGIFFDVDGDGGRRVRPSVTPAVGMPQDREGSGIGRPPRERQGIAAAEDVQVAHERATGAGTPGSGVIVDEEQLRQEALERTRACIRQHAADVGGTAFLDCVADSAVEQVAATEERRQLERNIKEGMSDLLRNYTCADPAMETTPAVVESVFERGNQSYHVKQLLNTSNANIWMVENFITDEECAAIEAKSRSRFRRATVSAAEGGSEISNHRKAQQTSYDVDLDNPDDPLYDYEYRLFDLVEAYNHYGLTPEGQETFTVIQYDAALGKQSSQEYRPHCDGACDGLNIKDGARQATVIAYCKTADRGGDTTFTKAGVYVKAKKNAAVMFTYLGPDGRTDDGLTLHSGCPVTEGEKILIARWLRHNVSRERPWTRWDPSGNLEPGVE